MPLRAALYVDGFNLYHALDDLQRPYLKWLNLWALGQRMLLSNDEALVSVTYCTAINRRGNAEKNQRHREYINALRYYGVTIEEGHFIIDQVDCRNCGHVWDRPQEKETDVNIAVNVIDDAYQDVFDVAYLLTSDSDQGATAKMFARRFPEKKLVSVAAPAMEISKAISPTHTPHKLKLPTEFIEDCLLPGMATAGDPPAIVFQRPASYKPPDGWISPKAQRAAKNAAKTS